MSEPVVFNVFDRPIHGDEIINDFCVKRQPNILSRALMVKQFRGKYF